MAYFVAQMFAIGKLELYNFLTFQFASVLMAQSLPHVAARGKEEFNFFHTRFSLLLFPAFLHTFMPTFTKYKLHQFLALQMLMLRMAFVWTGVSTLGHWLDTRIVAVHAERYITGGRGVYLDCWVIWAS